MDRKQLDIPLDFNKPKLLEDRQKYARVLKNQSMPHNQCKLQMSDIGVISEQRRILNEIIQTSEIDIGAESVSKITCCDSEILD